MSALSRHLWGETNVCFTSQKRAWALKEECPLWAKNTNRKTASLLRLDVLIAVVSAAGAPMGLSDTKPVELKEMDAD